MQMLSQSVPLESPFDSGITEQMLIDVVLRGEARRNDATRLDAPTRGALECYFEKVRAMREYTHPIAWTLSNHRNYCTVVSPDERHAIAMASGNSATGLADCEPATARPLGVATRDIVCVNEVQCSLPFYGPEIESMPSRLTWLLLTHRADNIVRAELSLPYRIDDKGYVCKFRQRYILDPIDLSGPTPGRQDGNGGGDGGGEEDAETFDVPVGLR